MKSWFEIQCWLKKFYRHGTQFQKYARMLSETYCLSSAELEAYQNKHLQNMIRHCQQNIPYYQDMFREHGIRPEHIQTREDLIRLPLLDKKTVKANFDKLIAKKHRNFLCNMGSTSGSTGTPSKFMRDFDAINFEHAIVWRNWRNAGDNGKKRITLRGDVIVPASQNHPPFWRYNPANRELQMSSYHLSWDNSEEYIRKIQEFQPKILYCGPSMGYVLAKFFRYKKTPYQFDAVFTSSESLKPEVRSYIEETFQCKIYDWYGQAERVAAIAQCQHGDYHIQEDYSIVELLPSQEDPSFELIGTQLHNEVMPLLRYCTQDFVYTGSQEVFHGMGQSAVCSCGSSFRKIDWILGRSYGYILTPEGYHIAITAPIPIGVENVIETQFYQEKHGEVVLRVITNGNFTSHDRDRLVANTRKYTSPQMNVIVEEVKEIPRGPNGKFINIINKMPGTTPIQS